GEIVRRFDQVAIGYLRHGEPRGLEEGGEHELVAAGGARPVELAGLRARLGDKITERFDLERCRYGDHHDGVRHARDRYDVFWLVWQVLVDEGMGRERAARRGGQHVIVVGADEG